MVASARILGVRLQRSRVGYAGCCPNSTVVERVRSRTERNVHCTLQSDNASCHSGPLKARHWKLSSMRLYECSEAERLLKHDLAQRRLRGDRHRLLCGRHCGSTRERAAGRHQRGSGRAGPTAGGGGTKAPSPQSRRITTVCRLRAVLREPANRSTRTGMRYTPSMIRSSVPGVLQERRKPCP